MDPGLGLSPEMCADGDRAREALANDLIHLWDEPTGVLGPANGEVFEVDQIGPHVVMWKDLPTVLA